MAKQADIALANWKIINGEAYVWIPGREGTVCSSQVIYQSLTQLTNSINVDGLSTIFVEFDVATNALDAFEILGSADGSTYHTFFNATTDFTPDPKGLMISASGDLVNWGTSAPGWFMMDVAGLRNVQIKMRSSAAGGSTIDCIYHGD